MEGPLLPNVGLALLGELLELGKEIQTQDNRSTSDAIPTVQEKVWTYGLTSDYADEMVCVTSEGDVLEEGETSDEVPPDEEITWTGRKASWNHVQTFLTVKAAEEFIAQNHHNYLELRVYIESAHRNPEMRRLRQALIALVQSQLTEATSGV